MAADGTAGQVLKTDGVGNLNGTLVGFSSPPAYFTPCSV